MNRKIFAVIVLQSFLIVMLFWVLVFYGRDEYEAYMQQGEVEEEIDTPNRASTEQGIPVVTLPGAAQEQSGIEIAHPASGRYIRELQAHGAVVAIDDLIAQRSRHLAARAEARAARAAIANSQQEFDRLVLLNKDDHNVSDRAVAAAEARLKADQARMHMAEDTADGVYDGMVQQWGATLAAQATRAENSPDFTRLMRYRDVLIQVTLPFDAATPSAGSTLAVMPVGGSDMATTAHFVSSAPTADSVLPGKTYYYRAAADALRVGSRVRVTLKDARDATRTGVVVPGSAVVWYGGQAWVYRKDSADRFIRTPVSTAVEMDGGWFNENGLQADDQIVVTGAQLLLSEEFKYQITNENDD